jgi:glycosyltransferase involved in cell wall biosynthesis
MRLTVGFDATPAAAQAAGIGRYARQLLSALSQRDDDFAYRAYYCGGGLLRGSLPNLDSRFRVRKLPLSDRVMNTVWHRARLPLPVELITGSFDVFHSPDFSLPPTLGKPTVLTIHDLAFLTTPDCAYPTLRSYLEKVVPRSARRATRVIAVSDHTRHDVISYLEIEPEKVVTVLEGVSNHFRPIDLAAAKSDLGQFGVHRPFILSVGTLEPRKNYTRLLEAYSLLRQRGVDQDLVIVGGHGWLYEPILRRLDELQLQQWVILKQLPDTALPALYSACDAFVYPSLYEGFGMPPLEALACGAPVACSDTSSLPEVVGDAALTFDPLDEEQIAESIWQIVSDDLLRQKLKASGPPQAARFSWGEAAQRTVAVYEEAALSA